MAPDDSILVLFNTWGEVGRKKPGKFVFLDQTLDHSSCLKSPRRAISLHDEHSRGGFPTLMSYFGRNADHSSPHEPSWTNTSSGSPTLHSMSVG